MTYGLTPQGFNPKSATQILAEINAAQRANPALGADFDNSPDSAVGQINAAFAAQIGEGWAALASVYASRKPRAAAAAGLDATVDAAAAILGLRRRNAVKGTVDITLRLAAGARVPAGVVIAVEGDPTNRWVTREAASNTSGGTVARTVAAEAETAGLFTADARTITSIATPMAGLLGASNDDDAFEGAPAEGSTILAGRIAAALDGSPLVRALYKVPRVRTVAVARAHLNWQRARYENFEVLPDQFDALKAGENARSRRKRRRREARELAAPVKLDGVAPGVTSAR